MSEKLVYEKLTYKLNGLFFQVHNQLGRFCKEKQYADALEIVLKQFGIAYKREYGVPFIVNGEEVKGNRVDFIIEEKIVVELKAKPFVVKEDYYQLQRYLEATGYRLGIIINFRKIYLQPKRVLNPASINVSVDQHNNP